MFPENLRGFGEGHYPWDLGSKSMMTNATVANAVKGADGQTVTVTYKGGEKKIDIPDNVPVVALVPADKADITPGASDADRRGMRAASLRVEMFRLLPDLPERKLRR